jgi:hypothetical protein
MPTANPVLRTERRMVMLRNLFTNMGFTLSVFATVAVVFFYAVFF